ncbi:MAG: cyclic pyranopterin monophosphate synthase MoaC [Gammaproteobacteria bacterium]|jgi:cyclic pyranopterin monophosphate synthase|nr:cyclic pyranopterin monophosphate synthase MoaC [Gammaproteobacteria bacterium]MBT7603826.1 cyclic pyranopterin monophosphate synthase MoaC [Gammaproteobacteria bacterium]
MKKNLTHFTKTGDAQMVDIKDKDITNRIAVASGKIFMSVISINKIKDGTHKKGDVLGIARIAAITSSKKTSELIPLCHNINLSSVKVIFKINSTKKFVSCEAIVETTGQTGVEMEALTAVQIGLLTIYDMCKSIDRGMIIGDIMLESKKGGASGEWKRSKK